ncbi:hypothetical protein YC2023_089549 [Brassica napus]
MGIMVLFLDEKVNSVIHGFIHAGRAKNYMLSLKAGSIVKVDRFEVARCSSMYKIIDHPFVILGKIRYVQGFDLTKETTRVVIHLLIDPVKRAWAGVVKGWVTYREVIRDTV